jgi:hypothetical protein
MKKFLAALLVFTTTISISFTSKAEITAVEVDESGTFTSKGEIYLWGTPEYNPCKTEEGVMISGCQNSVVIVAGNSLIEQIPEPEQPDLSSYFTDHNLAISLNFQEDGCEECANRSEFLQKEHQISPVKIANLQFTDHLNADFLGFERIYPDISNHDYQTAIEYLNREAIATGYPDGTFRPYETINRAEFTKIIVENRFSDGEIYGENCFSDVKTQWFAKYICTAKREGIINGYPDGTFKPADPVNFAEAAKIITSNGMNYTIPQERIMDTEGGYNYQQVEKFWYYPYVGILSDHYYIPVSIKTLNQKITRSEMAEIIYRRQEKITNKESNSLNDLNQNQAAINGDLLRVNWNDQPRSTLVYELLTKELEISPVAIEEELASIDFDFTEDDVAYNLGLVQDGQFAGYSVYSITSSQWGMARPGTTLAIISPDKSDYQILRLNSYDYANDQVNQNNIVLKDLGFKMNNELIIADFYPQSRIMINDFTLIRNRKDTEVDQGLVIYGRDRKTLSNATKLDTSQLDIAHNLYRDKTDNAIFAINNDGTISMYRIDFDSLLNLNQNSECAWLKLETNEFRLNSSYYSPNEIRYADHSLSDCGYSNDTKFKNYTYINTLGRYSTEYSQLFEITKLESGISLYVSNYPEEDLKEIEESIADYNDYSWTKIEGRNYHSLFLFNILKTKQYSNADTLDIENVTIENHNTFEDTITFTEFINSKPLYYLKDPFGAYIQLTAMPYTYENLHSTPFTGKPVIYLYPKETQDIEVKVHTKAGFIITEPEYNDGWKVRSDSESNIYNYTDGQTYPYLFWESYDNNYQLPTEGFIMEKTTLEEDLTEKLLLYGLNAKEAADFMEFWYPLMLEAKEDYFLVKFIDQDEFDRKVPLEITPKPDTVIRVMMDYQNISQSVEIAEPVVVTPKREGFTVVEWGGVLK